MNILYLILFDYLINFIPFLICFSNDLKKNKKRLVLLFICTFFIQFIVRNYIHYLYWLIGYTTMFLFLHYSFDTSLYKKIFYYCFISVVGNVVYVTFDILLHSYDNHPFYINIACYLISFSIVLLFAILNRKSIRNIFDTTAKQLCYFIVPVSIIYVVLVEHFYIYNTFTYANILLFIFCSLFIIATLQLLLLTIIKNQQLAFERQKNSVIEEISKQIDTLKNQHNAIRKYRHESSNTLLLLNTMIINEEYEQAKTFIDNKLHSININNTVITNDIYIDAVINNKKSSNNTIIIDVDYTKEAINSIDSIDKATIIKNMLDNAITELNTHPELKNTVNLKIKDAKTMTVIECFNESSSYVDIDSITRDENHGFGIEIIKDIISKYNGNIYFNQKNGFLIKIVMFDQYI